MQKYQNTNTTKYKRNSILGVPIENQCLKGEGLLYGGCILIFLHFVLFIFCCICILLHLFFGNLYFVPLYFVLLVFWNFCILFCFVFCSICISCICILLHLYFGNLYFVLLYFILFVFWNFCILSCSILFRLYFGVVFCFVRIMEYLCFVMY